MILTANSEVARETTRRKTGNGWHTTFIGENRNTLKQGQAAPEAGVLPLHYVLMSAFDALSGSRTRAAGLKAPYPARLDDESAVLPVGIEPTFSG